MQGTWYWNVDGKERRGVVKKSEEKIEAEREFKFVKCLFPYLFQEDRTGVELFPPVCRGKGKIDHSGGGDKCSWDMSLTGIGTRSPGAFQNGVHFLSHLICMNIFCPGLT